MPRFSTIKDLISPATLGRIMHYAEVVEKDPRTIIDRELNHFMDEKGEYNMQQLAIMDSKKRKRRKQLEQPICISSSPTFQADRPDREPQ